MVKLGNPKNAIWEAFLVTIVVFIIGLLLGVAYENSTADKINEYYANSEISLMDAIALNNLLDLENGDCDVLINGNIKFADRIYQEALLLEKYEDAGKVKNDLWLAHKKYDTLRTFLWINTIKTLEDCKEDFSLIIYLYEYEAEDLNQKATQNVWSRVLSDLKEKRGSDIILIPIAADSDLASLEVLISRFEISQYPVIIINEEHLLYEPSSVEDLEKYLE